MDDQRDGNKKCAVASNKVEKPWIFQGWNVGWYLMYRYRYQLLGWCALVDLPRANWLKCAVRYNASLNFSRVFRVLWNSHSLVVPSTFISPGMPFGGLNRYLAPQRPSDKMHSNSDQLTFDEDILVMILLSKLSFLSCVWLLESPRPSLP